MNVENLFQASGIPPDREWIQCLAESGGVRVERIVSQGQASPAGFWYDQPHAEWVVLLRGAASLEMEGEGTMALAAGDSLLIPAHRRHRVERTSGDAIWVAVHFAGDGEI